MSRVRVPSPAPDVMKVALIGETPEKRLISHSLRAIQFLEALLTCGYEVAFIFKKKGDLNRIIYEIKEKHPAQLVLYPLSESLFVDPKIFEILELNVDCVVAASYYFSYLASLKKHDMPLWCDMMGDIFAESQLSDFPEDYEKACWMTAPVLLRADKLSVISEKQIYFALGEAAVIGRVNPSTSNYTLVNKIPLATPPNLYPRKNFVSNNSTILVSGSLNAWFDYETLLLAVKKLVDRVPKIKLYITGGKVDKYFVNRLADFKKKIMQLKLEDRCKFFGWVDEEELCYIEEEVAIMVVAEARSLERKTGSSYRMLRAFARGIPVVSTLQSELAEIAKRKNALSVYSPHNSDELADTIESLLSSKSLRQTQAENGLALARNFTAANVTKPLISWVADPKRAPDNFLKVNLLPINRVLQFLNNLNGE